MRDATSSPTTRSPRSAAGWTASRSPSSSPRHAPRSSPRRSCSSVSSSACRLLTGGARDAPERQQTLRATIEWSYDLLDDEAKQLFARLAVFAGSFPLEAAEEVCDADAGRAAALVDLSLLKPVDDSGS